MCTLQEIQQVLLLQKGVIFADSAQVCRAMYSGRGIIAPNVEFSPDLVDARGYLPVEWWIMSKTPAKNSIPIKNEGITSLLIHHRPVLLPSALKVAEKELMGDYSSSWPLTKVLDIGGVQRIPNYTENNKVLSPEAPPIPCHVHAGDVVGQHCMGHGKTEAYFFPPLDVPPYNLQLTGVKTRLGLKPGVSKEQVLSSLKEFGNSDDLYSLLNEYEIHPWESWTIEEKIVHAPGPWLTFEIQLPQDDFHLLAWVMGTKVSEDELPGLKEDYHLRGLISQEHLLQETIDWEGNTDPGFKANWWRSCEVLEEGEWGKMVRLFYHIFYGEGLIIRPGQVYERAKDTRPYAGIVWSGCGLINGLKLDCKEKLNKEFLVCPGHPVKFENSSTDRDIYIFTVFPMKLP